MSRFAIIKSNAFDELATKRDAGAVANSLEKLKRG
jgi:hypothetical protein